MANGKMPAWIENLILKAVKEFLPPSMIVEAFAALKLELFARARAAAAATDNAVDDMLVAKLESILNECTPDSQFICDLIQRGESAVVEFLRKVASSTPNKIDDAAVDILEEAFKHH